MDFDQNPTMSTNYVQTRWYRAPELLLNNSTVSKAIDMWSVGCIMAELLSRRVMFQGISPIEQMKLIVQTLGTPDISNIKGCKEGVDFVRQLPHSKGKRFEDMFPLANPQALDVLKQMLQFNPDKRTDALTALRHPYFRQYYDERDIVAADSKFDFSFEDHLHDWNSIKREAYSTILAFNHINPRNATNDYSYFDEFRFNPVSEAMKEFQEAQDEEREEERRKHITKNSPLQTRKIIHPQPNYYAPAERPRTEDEKPPTGLRNNRRFSLVRKIKQALKI
jgi:mitogen-activated protein kinase 1/3